MKRTKKALALLCIRASSALVDLALKLTPSTSTVTLLDDMDDDMERALRDADMLGRAFRQVIG